MRSHQLQSLKYSREFDGWPIMHSTSHDHSPTYKRLVYRNPEIPTDDTLYNRAGRLAGYQFGTPLCAHPVMGPARSPLQSLDIVPLEHRLRCIFRLRQQIGTVGMYQLAARLREQ